MTTEVRLLDVCDRKLRCAFVRLEKLCGLAKVLAFEMLEVKLVLRFEYALERVLQIQSIGRRVGNAFEHFAQFSDGRDAYFIPIEVRFLDTTKALVRLFVLSVFQAAREQEILHDAASRWGDRLVVLLQHRVDLTDNLSTVGCSHNFFVVS